MSGDTSASLPTGLGCEDAEKTKQKLEDYGLGASECASHTFEGTKRGCTFSFPLLSLSLSLSFLTYFVRILSLNFTSHLFYTNLYSIHSDDERCGRERSRRGEKKIGKERTHLTSTFTFARRSKGCLQSLHETRLHGEQRFGRSAREGTNETRESGKNS